MEKVLLVQDDLTILLQTNFPNFSSIRDAIIKFAEIQQSPDSLYIFKITNLSIWNAAALGISESSIYETLKNYSTNDIPKNVLDQIHTWFNVYGLVKLVKYNEELLTLQIQDTKIKDIILKEKTLKPFLQENFLIKNVYRGEIKLQLMRLGFPVEDQAGFTEGTKLNIDLNKEIKIREYQLDASKAVYEAGTGVVILPCGSGKTIVGLHLLTSLKRSTLIVTNCSASTAQWKKSILATTNISEDQVSIYNSKNKIIAPITITTYNMIAYKTGGEYIHFKEFENKNWGLFIADEVHLAPANTFRIISSFQSIRRLGLTATLVREDGKESDIFSLIGVKRFEKPWKDLEVQGHIAELNLHEVKIPMNEDDRLRYSQANNIQEKFEIAASSKSKLKVIKDIINQHKTESILIIGHFTKQLIELGKELNLPVVCGNTKDKEREQIYDEVRNGQRKVFIASKVANAALDIPNLSVLIQVSFQYSSRNEEAQRQGRITRPNKKIGNSYTLVSEDTVEEVYNHNRMTFLTNEGYKYNIKRG